MNEFRFIVTIVVVIALFPVSGLSQESAEELAKATQNPIAKMISFPFQNNTNFGIGHYDHTQNILNIQPVLPFFKSLVSYCSSVKYYIFPVEL